MLYSSRFKSGRSVLGKWMVLKIDNDYLEKWAVINQEPLNQFSDFAQYYIMATLAKRIAFQICSGTIIVSDIKLHGLFP